MVVAVAVAVTVAMARAVTVLVALAMVVCVCVLTWAPAREDFFAILGTFKPCCMDPPRLAS